MSWEILLIIGGIIVGAVFLSFLVLLFADIEKITKFKDRFASSEKYYSFEAVRSRPQILELFKELFIDFQFKTGGGRILLMSNTGGYPEYDPYSRILELSSSGKIAITIAVTKNSFRDYYSKNPEIAIKVATNPNIRLFLFDNLTPYRFRVGINTEIGKGFFCGYHGQDGSKVKVEGIVSENSVLLEAFESLFEGLLLKGEIVGPDNLNEIVR